MRGILPLTSLLAASVLTLSSCSASSDLGTRGRYAEFRDAKLHYFDEGVRSPAAIILVHGWSCDAALWEHQLAALSREQRVIAIDLPGHGRSDAPLSFEYGTELFSEAIDAVLVEAGVSDVVLVGHGMGAGAVRRYAVDFPEAVRGLVLINETAPAISLQTDRGSTLSALREPDYRRTAATIAASRLRTAQRRERSHIAARMINTPQHVLIGTLAALEREQERAEPGPMQILVIENEACSGCAPRPDRDVHYVRAPGDDEFIMLDQPALVSTEIARFAATLLAGARASHQDHSR